MQIPLMPSEQKQLDGLDGTSTKQKPIVDMKFIEVINSFRLLTDIYSLKSDGISEIAWTSINEIRNKINYTGRMSNNYWNDKERCKLDALKYKTRFEWQLINASAYTHALKNGWLDELTLHMKRYNAWSEPNIRELLIDKKISSTTEWLKVSHSSYSAARRIGISKFRDLVLTKSQHSFLRLMKSCPREVTFEANQTFTTMKKSYLWIHSKYGPFKKTAKDIQRSWKRGFSGCQKETMPNL